MRRLGAYVAEGGGRGFDSLRLLAATGVLVSHSFSLTGFDHKEHEPLLLLTGRWSIGGISVALFFIISGFLIAQSADRNPKLSRFVEKRLLRILPALAVHVFAVALFFGPMLSNLPVHEYFASRAPFGFLKIALFLSDSGGLPGVFVHNTIGPVVNGSLWTLRTELACYGMAAAAAYLLSIRSVRVYVLAGAATVGLEAVLALPATSHVHLFGLFLAGMSFYHARAFIPVSRVYACIGLLLFGLSLVVPPMEPIGVYGLAYATVVSGYLAKGFRILHHRDYSYGLYLWAFPIQQAITQFRPLPWWANTLAAFPITLLFAMLSWHFVEKPAKAVKLTLGWKDAAKSLKHPAAALRPWRHSYGTARHSARGLRQ